MADFNDFLLPGETADSNDIQLQSNTGSGSGSNDSGSGFFKTLQDAVTTGANVYKTVNGQPKKATAATWTKYLPLMIGGVVLIVVLGIVFRR
jgi:hypothetical protein